MYGYSGICTRPLCGHLHNPQTCMSYPCYPIWISFSFLHEWQPLPFLQMFSNFLHTLHLLHRTVCEGVLFFLVSPSCYPTLLLWKSLHTRILPCTLVQALPESTWLLLCPSTLVFSFLLLSFVEVFQVL